MPTWTPQDQTDLRRAADLLEHPGVAAKLTNLIGAPVERGMAVLPAKVKDVVIFAVHKSLHVALKVAVHSIDGRDGGSSHDFSHKVAVSLSGAAGGAFGLAALPFELPVSTAIMLRSIADIARSEGEDISSIDTRLACLEVFALGGRAVSGNGAETGYFATRTALARAVTEAAKYIVEKGIAEESAPVLVRLIGAIASRYGLVVSEKAAASAIPAIGAAGGAIVNAVFIGHFQDMARGHFTIRRLERIYGRGAVEIEYERVR